jgi:hypothetical protein
MGGITVVIKEDQISKIHEAGAFVTKDFVVAPRDGKMMLIRSEDGTILIDGEVYITSSLKESNKCSKSVCEPYFTWEEGHSFHKMEMGCTVPDHITSMCNQFGYHIFGDRMSEDGWVVLRQHVSSSMWRYNAGRIIEGKLHLVGRVLDARIPEEAVGHCYCSKMYGDNPGDEYKLYPVAG